MGLNPQGIGCLNKGRCSAISHTLHNKVHPDPDAVDALDWGNPSLINRYDSASGKRYWVVKERDRLPMGYVAAEDVRLPCVVNKEVIEVVAFDRGYMPAVRNPRFLLEINNSPIWLIEWSDNSELRQIYAEDNRYWCSERRDGTLLCSSDVNDPIEGEYWLSPSGVEGDLSFYGKPKRVELTPERLEALKPWLENIITVEEQHYCVICQDAVYEDRFGSCECNHIHYSEWLGSWGGCGYGGEDLSEDYRVAIAKLPLSAQEELVRHLQAKDIRRLWGLALDWRENELDPAAAWVKSLDEDTPDAIAQTLSWLEH